MATFTIDPTLSSLDAVGLIVDDNGGFAQIDDDTYNNPATYSGTIVANVASSSVSFPGGSNIDATVGPAQTVDPTLAPADYTFYTQFGSDAIALAYRDLHLDITGTVDRTADTFDTQALTGALTAGTIGARINATDLSVPAAGVDSSLGLDPATITRANGLITLTIPVDVVYQFTIDNSAGGGVVYTDYIELTGTIVATAPVGPVGTITGSVANDLNDDGTRQSAEPGLSGRTVYLDLNNNKRLDTGEPSSRTDLTGAYTLTDLDAGTYVIRAASQDGFRFTGPGDGAYTASVALGATASGQDFLITKRARISGTIKLDANGNGKSDKRDTPLAGYLVYIDSNGNGAFDGDERSTRTDDRGNYTINRLGNGTSNVRVGTPSVVLAQLTDKPAGVDVTYGSGGLRPLTPSAGSYGVKLSTAANVVGQDFLLSDSASVSGQLFADRNGNGKRDKGETALPGVRLFVDLNDNGKRDDGDPRATSDVSGNYFFDAVPAGKQSVRVIPGDGYVVTTPKKGKARFTLALGAIYEGLLFGLQKK